MNVDTFNTDGSTDFTDTEKELIECLPASRHEISEDLNISESSVSSYISRVRKKCEKEIQYDRSDKIYRIVSVDSKDEDESTVEYDNELSDREEYILKCLPASATEIHSDIDVPVEIVHEYMSIISDKGFHIEFDEESNIYYSEQASQLRSSEAMGTRTREANEWIQREIDRAYKNWRGIDTVDIDGTYSKDGEDVVSHLTDLHMGDLIQSSDGRNTYDSDIVKEVIDYITRKQVKLTQLQPQKTDQFIDLWGGDFLTNEGIYHGQIEDIGSFLSQQHDEIIQPLMSRIRTLSEEFETVRIVCKTGNHGEIRASGTSRDANVDQILYLTVRNYLGMIQTEYDDLTNVEIVIPEGVTEYHNFWLRNGKLKGHLRHGDNRKNGNRTSAEKKEWLQTLVNHEFDLAYMGHVHEGMHFNVNGQPVIVTGSPKPSDDFAEKIPVGSDYNIASLHGVSDDGLTWMYPIDFRDFVYNQDQMASYSDPDVLTLDKTESKRTVKWVCRACEVEHTHDIYDSIDTAVECPKCERGYLLNVKEGEVIHRD